MPASAGSSLLPCDSQQRFPSNLAFAICVPGTSAGLIQTAEQPPGNFQPRGIAVCHSSCTSSAHLEGRFSPWSRSQRVCMTKAGPSLWLESKRMTSTDHSSSIRYEGCDGISAVLKAGHPVTMEKQSDVDCGIRKRFAGRALRRRR